MSELPKAVQFKRPDWISPPVICAKPRHTDDERMQLAIELARQNVEHGGGLFGAVVFDDATGEVVAPDVNLVLPQSCSLLHAEIVALMFAQARLKSLRSRGFLLQLAC